MCYMCGGKRGRRNEGWLSRYPSGHGRSGKYVFRGFLSRTIPH